MVLLFVVHLQRALAFEWYLSTSFSWKITPWNLNDSRHARISGVKISRYTKKCYIVLCHSPGCTESVLNGLYDQLVLDPIDESRLWLLHISIFTHLGTRPRLSREIRPSANARRSGAIEHVCLWRPWAHLMYDKNARRGRKNTKHCQS